MDWNTFIASVLTSTTLIAVAGYIFKRLFDKSFDVLAEKLKETNKTRIQENTRREAALYDERLELIKQCTSIVYRLRNNIRNLHSLDVKQKNVIDSALSELIDRIQNQYNILEELLYDSRAILPDEVFMKAHELKHNVFPIVNGWKAGQRITYEFNKNSPFFGEESGEQFKAEEARRDKKLGSVNEKLSVDISNCYQLAEALYESLVREANLFITSNK